MLFYFYFLFQKLLETKKKIVWFWIKGRETVIIAGFIWRLKCCVMDFTHTQKHAKHSYTFLKQVSLNKQDKNWWLESYWKHVQVSQLINEMHTTRREHLIDICVGSKSKSRWKWALEKFQPEAELNLIFRPQWGGGGGKELHWVR